MNFDDYVLDLINPEKFHENIDLSYIASRDQLIEIYKRISLIRKAELKLALEKKNNNIGGPVHLGAGQEAIAVGISQFLSNKDIVFGAHRSHAHILSLNPDLRKLFAEILGKDTGFSRGMGGSMHLWDQPSGFYGSVPIVAGTVPLAVGGGLALKLKNLSAVSVAYLGDGAIEEGVVAESLNLAKVLNSPTLFVLENNLFSSHMHITQRQPEITCSRFAQANSIEYRVVDGNNIIDVMRAAEELISLSKKNSSPSFLEAITFRHFGHVDWREDIDVGVNRSQEEVQKWKLRDPLLRMKNSLLAGNYIDLDELIDLDKVLSNDIERAWDAAVNDPYPKLGDLEGRLYAK